MCQTTQKPFHETLSQQQYESFLADFDELEISRNYSREERTAILDHIYSHRYRDILVDIVFKDIFSNPDYLKMLLGDILGEEIEELTYLPNELSFAAENDKKAVIDVAATIRGGKKIIVEMQRQHETGFRSRLLFYGAQMLANQIRKGEPYRNIQSVYVIALMNFTSRHGYKVPADKIMFRYQMTEADALRDVFSDRLNVLMLELPRMKKTAPTDLASPMEEWFYFMKNLRTFVRFPDGLNDRFRSIAHDAEIRQLDEKQQHEYLKAMITEEQKQAIAEANYEDGVLDGFDRGLEQGQAQAQKEMARRLLRQGILSLAQIAECTGLSEEEIKQL